jgi:predicted PurR-regulated permease PerM
MGPAVAHDLNLLFKTDLSARNPLVIIGVIVIIALFGVIGAAAGGIFTAALFRFFRTLTGGRIDPLPVRRRAGRFA